MKERCLLYIFLALLLGSGSGDTGGFMPQPPPPPPQDFVGSTNVAARSMGGSPVEQDANNMEHLTRYWGNVRPDALVIHSGSSGAFLPGQTGLFPQQQVGTRSSYEPTFSEQQSVGLLKHYISNSGTQSHWLRGASDAEIVRFLRARKGDVTATWQMLWEHSLWRMNPVAGGADTISPADNHNFEYSPLNQEMYWAGLASDGNPVLVFRSAHHQSGVDVAFFTRFVVWQLEKGKRLYGAGEKRQIYIMIDRSPSKTSAPMLGPAAVTSTLPLLKTVFKVVQDNYPEVLCKAFVAPVNAITRMLFAAVSSVIDEGIRVKIHLIKADDHTWWHGLFHPTLIPRELGGWSDGPRQLAPAVAGAPPVGGIGMAGGQGQQFASFPPRPLVPQSQQQQPQQQPQPPATPPPHQQEQYQTPSQPQYFPQQQPQQQPQRQQQPQQQPYQQQGPGGYGSQF